MFKAILAAAFQIDTWLHTHVGRLYGVILGIGLALAIGDDFSRLNTALQSSAGLFKSGLELAFYGALLINQLGQLHASAAKRRQRKAEKGGV